MASLNSNSSTSTVFVTVGTTHFDELIRAVDSMEFAQALLLRGYSSLIIQAGSGSSLTPEGRGYRPHILFPSGSRTDKVTIPFSKSSNASSNGGTTTSTIKKNNKVLTVEWFEYAPSLSPYLYSAALVISHAGAGSIFETLRRGVALIAVPNTALMDDHQRELADKLESEGHLATATPQSLTDVVSVFDGAALKRYVPGDGVGIVARIDALCGVAENRK